MRAHSLSTANAGMTRLRRKGKPSPATLYDCLNAYITIAGSIKPRPGTDVEITLPPGTKGLVAHKGKMTVFSHLPLEISDSRYVCVTLRHPNDNTIPLRDIHFAKPFMGYLYVVASFEDSSQWHYWAEELDSWEAEKVYLPGDKVFPLIPNGFAYRAKRTGEPAPLWAPQVERAIGDVIEPTASNGYQYTCIAVTGSKPTSGLFEPIWPVADGATVIEVSDDTTEPVIPVPPQVIRDPLDPRYRNPAFLKEGWYYTP